MADIQTRQIGEGNFSIGSAVKGGALSIKIDLNDMETTKKMIAECQQLFNNIHTLNKLKEDLY